MLAMTLASILLASAADGVQAALSLSAAGEDGIHTQLCFTGHGQQVRYRLQLTSTGVAGTSRSGQGGTLVATSEPLCPVRNRLGAGAGVRLQAELRWWVDGREQPPIRRQWPPAEAPNSHAG
ncbi:hypothetical protein AUR61_002630 [Stutzerimonas balearica]|nr:hypothetical protein AUR61_002630 [Stutzerimonas balearica]